MLKSIPLPLSPSLRKGNLYQYANTLVLIKGICHHHKGIMLFELICPFSGGVWGDHAFRL